MINYLCIKKNKQSHKESMKGTKHCLDNIPLHYLHDHRTAASFFPFFFSSKNKLEILCLPVCYFFLSVSGISSTEVKKILNTG